MLKYKLIEEAQDRLHGWSHFTRAAHYYIEAISEHLPEEVPEDMTPAELNALLLNGARNWSEASFTGCYLCYDGDLSKCLLPPSLRARNPGSARLLHLQADALGTAAGAIIKAYKAMKGGR